MEACKERYVFEYTWLLQNFRRDHLTYGAFKYSTAAGDFYEVKNTTFKSHNGSGDWFLSLVRLGSTDGNWDDDSWGDDDTHTTDNEFHIKVSCKNFSKIFPEKNVEIMIDNNKNDEKCYKVYSKQFLSSKEKCKSIKLFTSNQVDNLVNDHGDLTILLRIIEPFSIAIHTSEMHKLTCDFQKLLKLGDHSDFKIIIDKREFLVHKNILSARSDYFAAMFKHGTKEQDYNEVEISDVCFDVMSELLRYIYCATVNITEDLMYDLLTAADMYQIDALPKKCEETIIMHLKPNNVGECIVYAERYDNDSLKEASIDFLIKNVFQFKEDDKKQLKSSLTAISSPFMSNLVYRLLFKR